jgi:hypothetical protein
MKQIKKDLDTVLKELKTLTRKTEGMVKKIDRLGKAKAAKKPKTKDRVKKRTVPKKTKTTAIDTVFSIIKKSRKGVDAGTLKKKTGFDNKKVWNNINMLKVKGKIKSVSRGVYVKI